MNHSIILLGAIIASAGAGLWLIGWGLSRLATSEAKTNALALPTYSAPLDEGSQTRDAVIIIAAGGKVVYLNSFARQLFNLSKTDFPSLDYILKNSHPSEELLKLSAAPGQATITAGTTPVEAVSYIVPYGGDKASLITMRPLDLSGETQTGLDSTVHTLELFAFLTQSISKELDLKKTMLAMAKAIHRIIFSDAVRISLLDENGILHPYIVHGTPDTNPEFEMKAIPPHPPVSALAKHIIATKEPLLIPDVQNLPPEFRATPPHQPRGTYLGVPLKIDNRLIGLVEVGNADVNAYSKAQLEFLSMLANMAAVAIQNARTFTEAQERLRELQSLADLAAAVSGSRELRTLIQKILESIKPLIHAEMFGLLLYDEAHRNLIAQAPFHGLPDTILESYQGHVAKGSKAEEIIQSREPIVIEEGAFNDERIQALGFANFYTAASINSTVLHPLTSGGQFLGYLQVASTPSGRAITAEEQRVLAMAAAQIAPLLENAALFQQARERARRAEALRRIASLAASSASDDELLKFSLPEIAQLLGVKQAFIRLLDPITDQLTVHEPSLYGISKALATKIDEETLKNPLHTQSAAYTGKPFVTPNLQAENTDQQIYREIAKSIPKAKSLLAIPLKTERGSLGEIVLISEQEGRFDEDDEKLISAAAAQIGLALERQRLLSQGALSAQSRSEEINAIARLGRELSTLSSLREVLTYAHKQILNLTRATCGVTFLLNKQQSGYKIKERFGSQCQDALTALDKEALERKQALTVADYETDILQSPHEGIRSSLSVPLVYQGRAIGIIHLHSTEADHFNAQTVYLAQLTAQQIAIAAGNAQKHQSLLEENSALQLKAHALSLLRQFFRSDQPLKDPKEAIKAVVHILHNVTPFDAVWVGEYQPNNGTLAPLTSIGFRPTSPLPWDSLSLLLEDRFEKHGIYFIPSEEHVPIPSNLNLPEPETQVLAGTGPNSWRPDDLLIAPLRASNGQTIGVLFLKSPRDGRRPSQDTLDLIRLFASQLAWLLEAHKVKENLIKQQTRLEEQIQQAEAALNTVQKDVPRWLRKDLQQTLDRYRLAQQAKRLKKGLSIAALVNRQPGRSAVLDVLGTQLIEQFGFNYLLIAAPSRQKTGSIHLERIFGDVPSNLKIEILLGQRNPLSEVLREGKIIVVPDIQRDERWTNSPLLQQLDVQGFVAFPIYTEQPGESEEGAVAISHVVLAASCTPLLEFSDDEEAIFKLISRQVSITLDNLTMLSRTERRLREAALLLEFSSQLGVLDPDRIFNTLLNSTLGVLQNVHAGFIALWNEKEETLKIVASAGYARPDALKGIALPRESLPARVMFSGESALVDEVDFADAYPLETQDLLRYQTATAERLPVSSMIVPIRSGQNVLGAIVLDNFNTAAAFTDEDERLIFSLTQQTALALENARLLSTAERRATQLQALAKVSTAITAHSLSYEEVVTSLLPHLAEVIPFARGTLWLLDGNQLTVHDALGFENREELIGITTNVEDSALFQDMVKSKRPLVVHDVTTDPRFPPAGATRYRSWLGIPLVLKEKVLGVIALEKEEPHFFTPDWSETAETFAAQAAAALENARLYEETLKRSKELDERTRRLALVYQVTTELASSLNPHYIAQYTAERVHEALNKGQVAAVLWNEDQPVLAAEAPPSSHETPITLPPALLWEHLQESQGIFRAQAPFDSPLLAGLKEFIEGHGAQSVITVPMVSGQSMMGALMLFLRGDESISAEELELVHTLANQAAVALQNAQLYEATRRFSEELERRVEERTAELRREHHRSQTLLEIIGELAASLDLDQVLNRTLALLNKSLSADHSSILLARPGEKHLFLRAAYGKAGKLPLGGRPTTISIDNSLAGWVIAHREPVLIDDLLKDPRWNKEAETQFTHRSAICVPLIFGEETLGALMLFHEEPNHFTEYHLDLAIATAKQMAVTINQSEIFRLVNEQAEHLGRMARAQEIEARRAKAILEAIADGVIVTDKKNIITLFNPSASKILGLPAEQALGKPLFHFIGLFGGAGKQWIDTIHMWSENPEMSAEGITYEEQLELEDGRVISVHLAPVFSRHEFLGTVSVFRDITHQVEVDRLKSEFVATVSHELRTPMTAIKGYVDILLMGAAGPLTEQQRRFLSTVKSNTDRLNLLVSDLLDISRIEAGHISLTKEEIDLASIIQEVAAEMRRIAQEDQKPIEFEVDIPPNLPKVYADRERIRQVIENLVENAYRYTPGGGKVTVRAYLKGEDEVQVDVIDTGIGIPPEEQKRIFERFYRGENPFVMASSGTGLGLSIVKTLIEMHGGEIWVFSEGIPGKGSTFSFTLPLKEKEESDQK